ncbi:TPA: hypothetical protein DDW69_00190 [candidate division CPR2 bacterium]|uniref:Uncharacterized protein n=1 Tax=candidate division CPR2 bacterium GW2011_GWC1_41_48 TaxID=1618344 RepID=A0A0G0W6X0_UNCC2|nr:MAG: hypothetical protein UT47_C0005G0030 [candidate division CPR2 bacterium GW2011_GWC2_39_35]KKR28486.1 MAG: hypothetical protein UT60_C0019G0021 [candidate division CPR2 bacterium GW2011_GWD2_39_7]KKR29448.1 MAG: hypothetical protein UT59_C0007G0002 [candidate division CPR2 bacterium GW2011_GWD1_39_7]KKS08719.1 MAG: hypothetical protein UU65_C0005G0030 [candidate division CPR2 bacterium GW2011_GWC1_41_48]OGB55607.1 MAG: hypothetical protein A2Y27_03165 [candidate division CPR2 bacterium G
MGLLENMRLKNENDLGNAVAILTSGIPGSIIALQQVLRVDPEMALQLDQRGVYDGEIHEIFIKCEGNAEEFIC